jgi:hypothetical protein
VADYQKVMALVEEVRGLVGIESLDEAKKKSEKKGKLPGSVKGKTGKQNPFKNLINKKSPLGPGPKNSTKRPGRQTRNWRCYPDPDNKTKYHYECFNTKTGRTKKVSTTSGKKSAYNKLYRAHRADNPEYYAKKFKQPGAGGGAKSKAAKKKAAAKKKKAAAKKKKG